MSQSMLFHSFITYRNLEVIVGPFETETKIPINENVDHLWITAASLLLYSTHMLGLVMYLKFRLFHVKHKCTPTGDERILQQSRRRMLKIIR